MSEKPRARPERDPSERERPEPPETPFLCASCRHGLIVLQKVPRYAPWERRDEPWATGDEHYWDWESRCNNPRVAGRWPETFDHPVVDCEGYEMRDLCARAPETEEAGSAEQESS